MLRYILISQYVYLIGIVVGRGFPELALHRSKKISMETLSSKSERRYDLDWLRVLAFSLLILYHTGMFFVPWEWHIKNNRISEVFEFPMWFLSQWRMPLLFFISGAGVYFALGKRSASRFTGERLKRILLPLVFGMFIIVPPQIYYERLTQGVAYSSYFDFYPSVFDFQPYPEGNFSWHHLWYLAYIFTYSLFCLPMFLYFRSAKGGNIIAKLIKLLERKGAVFLLVVPLFISDAALRASWPTTHNLIADWANFTFSLLIFIYGFILCSNGALLAIIERHRNVALVVAMIAFILMNSLLDEVDVEKPPLASLLAFRFLKDLNTWSWLIAILGFAARYLNRPSRYLKYANEAVYPFYILHQTVIVVIGYYLINWQVKVGLKFLLITIATFSICWVLYEFIIRRTKLTRLLFGLKVKSRKGNKSLAVPQPVI